MRKMSREETIFFLQILSKSSFQIEINFINLWDNYDVIIFFGKEEEAIKKGFLRNSEFLQRNFSKEYDTNKMTEIETINMVLNDVF